MHLIIFYCKHIVKCIVYNRYSNVFQNILCYEMVDLLFDSIVQYYE